MKLAVVFAAALLLAATLPANAQTSRLLIVSGLGGEPQYSAAFHEWGTTLADAATGRYGLEEEDVVYLAERTERDPARINGRATRENVARELSALRKRSAAGDRLFIVLMGHGSSDGDESRINLPGPDLTAAGLNEMLDGLDTSEVAVVNTASASGGFIEALSGPNRTVITATQSGFERNATRFGEFFVQAMAGDGADLDKDNRVSLLEAFQFARREVQRAYEQQNLLLSEHALLEDDGDGAGSAQPTARGKGDGTKARSLFLAPRRGGAAPAAPGGGSPELKALRDKARGIEEQVARLRAGKDEMPPAEYQQTLERLLLDLARTNQQIRELAGGTP